MSIQFGSDRIGPAAPCADAGVYYNKLPTVKVVDALSARLGLPYVLRDYRTVDLSKMTLYTEP